MTGNSNSDLGFRFRSTKSDEVLISHKGTIATTLRGRKAEQFLSEIESLDESAQQQLMARLTGNYMHGSERQARNHPRNRR